MKSNTTLWPTWLLLYGERGKKQTNRHFQKMYFVFHRRNTVIQVWNKMRERINDDRIFIFGWLQIWYSCSKMTGLLKIACKSLSVCFLSISTGYDQEWDMRNDQPDWKTHMIINNRRVEHGCRLISVIEYSQRGFSSVGAAGWQKVWFLRWQRPPRFIWHTVTSG